MKKYINVENIIRSTDLRTLCTVYFNLIEDEDENYFVVKSHYKKSKFKTKLNYNDDLLEENNKLLINYTELPFFLKNRVHYCYIKKNLEFNKLELLTAALYKRIQNLRSFYSTNDFKIYVFVGLFGLRGSVDFSRNLYAVDLKKQVATETYCKNIFYLLTSIEGLEQLNFNFRDLQPEYIGGKKRDDQIRINLKYFYENFYKEIRKINTYKADIIEFNRDLFINKSTSSLFNNQFIERMMFYIKAAFSKEYSFADDIENLRKKLNLEIKPSLKRNTSIVVYAKALLPDICYGCYEKYKVIDRTFYYRNSENLYLEIHHVISFSNGEVDQIDNLVKLCPACHKALTPNRADEKYQKEIIQSILKLNKDVCRYVENFTSTYNIYKNIDYIYSKLK
ncbi:Type II restriction modification system endonuclease [Spiroplasma gladiatoris]|uniref:Type II restriction modification system endonuclease n=1 Tax=Spiroplasma gladiatoris TaxID=2143 RepID=A0A4P7AGS2_9MOLU|nr:HNH endonuclease signature motif containing protein [Spiroplasma gladiatoris]QBQ07614.1 Type II restriction modification system endonuclease [Spiroplasma gladiatoris]